MKKSILIICLCLSNFSALASTNRPDGHAPIGVMRDHTHKQGEVMLSYRHKYMKMSGAKDGHDNLSTPEVLGKYMMSPEKMTMKMHMIGGMYGVTDNLTLMAMGSFIEKDMKMVNRMYNTNERSAHGAGDLKVGGMYEFFNNQKSRAQFNLGLSIPTGSIKKAHDGSRLPYPMQLGSGSYEALPGLSYNGYLDNYSYGAQINSVFRLNDNNANYRLGDSYNATTWIARKLNNSFSISSRLDYTISQKIKNHDDLLNTTMRLNMMPANNPINSGGRRLDFLLGANFIVASGPLKGHRLAVEAGTPLYQKTNGTQLTTDYVVTAGWQKSF